MAADTMREFGKDHVKFWDKLVRKYDVGAVASPEAPCSHSTGVATVAPQPTSKVLLTNAKNALRSMCYLFLRRCPYAFFMIWLPVTLLAAYLMYMFLVQWGGLPEYVFAFHVIVTFPVWVIITSISLPASARFESERPYNKFIVAPGVYYQKGGVMGQIGQWYDRKVMRRYETGRDEEATPWLLGPDAQTMYPFIFANLKLGAFRIEAVNYKFVHIAMQDRDRVSLGWSFPPGGYTEGCPVLIVLHGLNGGAHSTMVTDAVARANAKGWTVE